MAKVKYIYNSDTCQYEKVTTPTSKRIYSILAVLFVFLSLSISFGWYIANNIESPKEKALKKENKELLYYYNSLNSKVQDLSEVLSSMQDRDDNVYRMMFDAEPIPSSVRKAGVGGSKRYQDILSKSLNHKDMVLSTTKTIDSLTKQLYIQSKSYDELLDLAKEKNELMASLPAIQPIYNKSLKHLVSGYGYRIDPIYKTMKFHAGLDFASRTGTEIYATGKGKVVEVGYTRGYSGYGKIVLIDHGYGYKTLYAHMNDYTVKKGQTVSRGELIGYVGSTGKSTGPHLHYEVIKNGKKENPINFFFNDLSPEEYHKMLEISEQTNQAMD